MSDTSDTVDTGTDAGGGGLDVATVDTAPVTEAPEVDIIDEEPAAGATMFGREYVGKVREQAANYRTRARDAEERLKPYAEALDPFSPEERQTVLGLAVALRENPTAAAEWMDSYVRLVREGETPDDAAAGATAELQDGEGDKPLTRAELEAYMAEREAQQVEQQRQADQQRTMDEMVEQLHSQGKELGYNPTAGWNDWQAHLDWVNVAALAANVTQGDIAKAHEMYAAQRSQAIGSWLERRQQDARSGAPGMGGQAPAPPVFEPGQKDPWAQANAHIAGILEAKQ